MFGLVENGVVIEVFEQEPVLHEDLMRSVIELEVAEQGDHVADGVNVGKAPSDFHTLQGPEWIEDTDAKNAFEKSMLKRTGFDYNGVMCSATRDDQNGLLAIAYKLQIMGVNFTPTVFEFDNGNKLTLTRQNFVGFQQKWLTFRDQFFQQNEDD